MIAVSISEHGAVSHTPVIPKIAGKTSVNPKRKTSEQMVEESSFSHGVTLDTLDDAGKLITVENLDSFTVIYERKKGNYHQLPLEWCRL